MKINIIQTLIIFCVFVPTVASDQQIDTLSIKCSDNVLEYPKVTIHKRSPDSDVSIHVITEDLLVDVFNDKAYSDAIADIDAVHVKNFLHLLELIYISNAALYSRDLDMQDYKDYINLYVADRCKFINVMTMVQCALIGEKIGIKDTYINAIIGLMGKKIEPRLFYSNETLQKLITNQHYALEVSNALASSPHIEKKLAERIALRQYEKNKFYHGKNNQNEKITPKKLNNISGICGIVFNPLTRELVAGDGKGNILIYPRLKKIVRKKFKSYDHSNHAILSTGMKRGIRSLAYKPNSSLLVAVAYEGLIQLWDTSLKTQIFDYGTLLKNDNRIAVSVKCLIDDKMYVQTENELILINANTGNFIETIPNIPNLSTACALSSCGNHLVISNSDGTIKRYDTRAAACISEIQGDILHSKAITFNSDGTSIAIGGELKNSSSLHSVQVLDWIMSDNSKTVLTPYKDDEKLVYWDKQEGCGYNETQYYEDCIRSIAFSFDGKYIATASNSDTVRIWDIKAGSFYHAPASTYEMDCVTFSPEGRFLIASSKKNENINIWNHDICRDYAQAIDKIYDVSTFSEALSLITTPWKDQLK